MGFDFFCEESLFWAGLDGADEVAGVEAFGGGVDGLFEEGGAAGRGLLG